jgi:DNA-binding transcriptional LysR family regulator
MPDRRQALTPDALAMMDTIARTGSFAAAARELGKVPSALTYSVRQLEDALDVLLFDRSSRTAQLTAAGQELLTEGRRLLQELDAVANRVRRVADGWEATLAISVEDIVCPDTMFDLVAAFCEVNEKGDRRDERGADRGHGTRLRLRKDVLTGTWEALVHAEVDLAIGVAGDYANPGGIETAPLGELPFVFCVAPHHVLAGIPGPLSDAQLVHHRAVAVADTAMRLAPATVNLLPGQDVLTVPTMRDKLEALLRGLGCGFVPETWARGHIESGRLVRCETVRPAHVARLNTAWRTERSDRGTLGLGKALQWWLQQLQSPVTRRALVLGKQAALRQAA